MPRFDSIVGQIQPKRVLSILLRKGIIPHALLFCGIDGVGKRTAALTFAMACNCLNRPVGLFQNTAKAPVIDPDHFEDVNPCGRCPSCQKILSNNHPDVITVAPSGPFIKIAQIRSLCETLSLKPYEANFRVIIISGAQKMNPEASNALLKLLEEPPAQTIFILTATQASDLLPTILSRCQYIHFHPIPLKDLVSLLTEKEGFPPAEAVVAAAISNGSLSKALRMKNPVKGSDGSHWVRWLLAASGLDQPEKLEARPIGFQLAFAEQLANNKELLLDALEVMCVWLRDLIVAKFCPEKLMNKDLADTIRGAANSETVISLLSKIDAVRTAQKSIQANANPRLTLESMMLKLAC